MIPVNNISSFFYIKYTMLYCLIQLTLLTDRINYCHLSTSQSVRFAQLQPVFKKLMKINTAKYVTYICSYLCPFYMERVRITYAYDTVTRLIGFLVF
jgi:hypothetical protein